MAIQCFFIESFCGLRHGPSLAKFELGVGDISYGKGHLSLTKLILYMAAERLNAICLPM